MARILIIDDESSVRKVLRHMLERDGHEVVEAPDGHMGLRLYREHPTDLIVTDILMPEKEGIETILELRKTSPGVRILAISGGGRMSKYDLLETAEKFGVAKTLAKPFERQEFLAAVQEMLAT